MKKKEILFTITAIFILMIITAYYVAFIKPKNINFEQPNIEIPEEDNNENIEEEPPIIEEPVIDEDTSIETSFINKYKWLGYKEVEIPNEMPEFEKQDNKMDKVEINETKNDNGYDDKICNIAFYSNLGTICVNVEVIDNKTYFLFNDNKIEIPIDNVKNVYISRYEFQSVDEFRIYFLTKDGDIYEAYQDEADRIFDIFIRENITDNSQLNKVIIERLNNSFKNIKKINNKIKYKEIFILKEHICGSHKYAGLGYDGETYLLQEELKFVESSYTYSQYSSCNYDEVEYQVTIDGDIIIDETNTNVKYKFRLGKFIFSDKNIIYNVEYNREKLAYELKEIGKLKLLYVNKKEEKIAILLDDGKTIEYSFSYEGLQNIDF